MQKTKWMTLAGSALAVLSSSVLYVNVVLSMFLGERGNKWHTSPYLNYWVFGLNLDSVLNDVGMLLVCGVLKTVPCTALAKIFSAASPAQKVRPVPMVDFNPNSQASSMYLANEVDAS